VLLLILCIAACQHGVQSNEAVRQGIIDHLSKAGINVAAMDLTLSSVQFNGAKADATISMTAKGIQGATPMSLTYHLEQQNNKWVVVGRAGSAGHPGSTAAPGDNPHGGGAMPTAVPGAENPPAGGSKMPSPQDLPPATKK